MLIYKYLIIIPNYPLSRFPQGEAGSLSPDMLCRDSEQAGLPRWPSLQAGSFAKPTHRVGSLRSALPWGKVGKGVKNS